MQLFFESQQEQVTKLLGKEGDLVMALMHNSGTWKLPVAVGAQIDTDLQMLLLMRMMLLLQQHHAVQDVALCSGQFCTQSLLVACLSVFCMYSPGSSEF